MVTQEELQKRWRSTLRMMVFVNVVAAGVIASLAYDRWSTGEGLPFPALVALGLALGAWSAVLFYVIRAIRNQVGRSFGQDRN